MSSEQRAALADEIAGVAAHYAGLVEWDDDRGAERFAQDITDDMIAAVEAAGWGPRRGSRGNGWSALARKPSAATERPENESTAASAGVSFPGDESGAGGLERSNRSGP